MKVAVGEVKDLHSSISPGQSQPLGAAVKRHGPDGTGHVVEEPNTVNLKLTHVYTNTKGEERQVGQNQSPLRERQHVILLRISKKTGVSTSRYKC